MGKSGINKDAMNKVEEKLNVCIVSYEFLPYVEGGTGVVTYEIAQCLAKKGHSITIVTLGDSNGDFIEKRIESVQVIYLRRSMNKILKILYFQFNVLRLFKNNINKFDVVQFMGNSGFLCMFILPLVRKSPCIVTRVAYDSLEGFKIYMKEFFECPSMKFVPFFFLIFSFIEEYFAAKMSNLVIVPSKELKTKLSSYGISQEKIMVIPNGVDIRKFEIDISKKECKKMLNLPADKKLILFIGRFMPEKGIHILLRAIKKVMRQNSDILLLLVGDGMIKANLENLSAELGIQPNIKFSGFVNRKDMAYYCKSSDIFVLPSFSETFGIVLLEASASGLPLVVSDLKVFKTIVKDRYNGLFTKRGDENDLADKIIYLLENEGERRRMGENARERAKEFTWERSAEDVESAYLRIMERGHS